MLRRILRPLAPPTLPPRLLPHRSLFIKISPTPNPDSMKFLPENREVLPPSLGGGLHFSDAASARGSPLARRLLKTKEITGVFLGPDFISVNKDERTGWAALKPIVVSAIMDAYAELDAKGVALVGPAPEAAADTAAQPEDTEVVAMIKELLETRIRPAVQEDGGDIFFVCVATAQGGSSGGSARARRHSTL
jgi:hypothetical protein